MNKKILAKKEIQRSFNQSANTYDEVAFLQREVTNRLLERLDYLRINPEIILDLGSGTGYATIKLRERYKKSKVIAVDLAEYMLKRSKQLKLWFDKRRFICADVESLPFKDSSADLIFSNFMLHWCNDLEKGIVEMRRVLKPGGLLLFSTLGPDTLYELRQSWAEIDTTDHVHSFIDMHILGDFLQKVKFKDPVVDMEFITITYNDIKKILLDLKDLGAHNIAKDRSKGLTGKKKFGQFVKTYEKYRNEEGYIPVTYEIVYGTAWGQEVVNSNNEFVIPLEEIKRKTHF